VIAHVIETSCSTPHQTPHELAQGEKCSITSISKGVQETFGTNQPTPQEVAQKGNVHNLISVEV